MGLNLLRIPRLGSLSARCPDLHYLNVYWNTRYTLSRSRAHRAYVLSIVSLDSWCVCKAGCARQGVSSAHNSALHPLEHQSMKCILHTFGANISLFVTRLYDSS